MGQTPQTNGSHFKSATILERTILSNCALLFCHRHQPAVVGNGPHNMEKVIKSVHNTENTLSNAVDWEYWSGQFFSNHLQSKQMVQIHSQPPLCCKYSGYQRFTIQKTDMDSVQKMIEPSESIATFYSQNPQFEQKWR